MIDKNKYVAHFPVEVYLLNRHFPVLLVFLFLFLTSSLYSCVMIFRTQNQRDVTVTTENEDPDTKIHLFADDDTMEGSFDRDLKRRGTPYQVRLIKDGYLDSYRVLYNDEFATGTGVCLGLDFLTVWTVLPLLDLGKMEQWYDYPDPYRMRPPQAKIPQRDSAERFLVFHSASLDLGKEDTSKIVYGSPEAYEKGNAPDEVVKREDVVQKSDILSDSTFRDLLIEIGYYDTSSGEGELVLNDYNTMGLRSKVSGIKKRVFRGRWNYFHVEPQVKWELLDSYGEPIYDTTLTAISGEFRGQKGIYGNRKMYSEMHQLVFQLGIYDGIARSLVKFLKIPEVKDLMDRGAITEEKESMTSMEALRIAQPDEPDSDNMNEQIKGVVTIKRKEGHGSGCIISKDGHIMTNYHVVSGKDSVDVLFGSERKKKAKVERMSKVMDVALIKVDTSDLKPLKISQKEGVDVGSEVMAIGTPQSIQLGQSVSKGIISGERNFNKVDYIQTDVSINSGNSGGALIDRDSGEMIGVVTAKMFGLGVDGIGFAVPAKKAMEKLKIEYE